MTVCVPLGEIKNFIEGGENFTVTVATVPADGRNPSDFTAGVFFYSASRAEVTGGGLIFSGEKGYFYFVGQAIGAVEMLENNKIRFAYENLVVAAPGFLKPVIVVVEKGG